MATNLIEPPQHSRRVQAWLHRVLYPVIDCLGREAALLKERNLTWRYYSRQCEYIRPIPEYVDSGQLAVYEDFLADPLNSGFRAPVEEHDRAILDVEAQARECYEGLLSQTMFINRIEQCIQEYNEKARSNPQYPALGALHSIPQFIAEYLVNGIEELPNHYGLHKFWEEYGHSLRNYGGNDFAGRMLPCIKLRSSADNLRLKSEKLLTESVKQRSNLSIRFDIPPAPLPSERD